jgi:ribosomal protein S18 acetylase RimI-like enzyme
MSDSMAGLFRLEKDGAKKAVAVLGKAFKDYPMLGYFYPDEPTREKIALAFVAFTVYSGLRYGEVYATSRVMEGVAVWFYSDYYPLGVRQTLISVPWSAFFIFAFHGGIKMRTLGEHVDGVHKRIAPFRHMYLQVLGVDPAFQGKGFSGKLVRPMLDRMDKEGLPCYLETLDKNNVKLYEHFGFRTIDESVIPGTELINWAMLRKKMD